MDDDDDLLAEVLLRLPPQPSSLPRASLVCPRWRRLLADPGFLRRFRAHHRKPPLLGFFSSYFDAGPSFSFIPVLDPPDRIPAARFSLPLDHGQYYHVLACHHGRVLILNRKRLQLVVWNPVTGEQLHLAVPPPLHTNGIYIFNGAMLCAVRCQGHLRDGCCHSAYQVALFGVNTERVFACAYSSQTGAWGSLVSTACRGIVHMGDPFTLVGDSLYSIMFQCAGGSGIVHFDLDTHSLGLFGVPPDKYGSYGYCCNMRTEDGFLGLIFLLHFRAQLWKLMPGCDGVAEWVRGKTIELDMLRSTVGRDDLYLKGFAENLTLKGFAEDNDVMLVGTTSAVFMVNIQSTKFKKLSDSPNVAICHPFASFYGASNNMPLHTYSAGYRPTCSGLESENPSNLPPDQDELGMPQYTQPPLVTQETQGTQDVEQPQGRTRRMTHTIERYSPSPIPQQLKKKSKKTGGGSRRD